MKTETDLKTEAAAFRAAHPEVETLPEEVAARWAGGDDLTSAYHRHQQKEQDELAVLRQNAQNQTRAPVRPAAVNAQPPKGHDAFLRGLESEGW